MSLYEVPYGKLVRVVVVGLGGDLVGVRGPQWLLLLIL